MASEGFVWIDTAHISPVTLVAWTDRKLSKETQYIKKRFPPAITSYLTAISWKEYLLEFYPQGQIKKQITEFESITQFKLFCRHE